MVTVTATKPIVTTVNDTKAYTFLSVSAAIIGVYAIIVILNLNLPTEAKIRPLANKIDKYRL
jgi:hypothetical protein